MLPIAMVRLDSRGTALFMNRACRDLLSSMGTAERDFPEILPKRHRTTIRNVLADRHSEDLMSRHHGRVLRMVFKPSDNGVSVFLFIIDLTDEEEVKAQLLQSEKMASLGLLIAGLAHEINTPLGAIHSNNDTMSKSVARVRELLKPGRSASASAPQSVTRVLDILDELCRNTAVAAERLIGISDSLREFIRRDEASTEKVDIHEGLDKTLTIVQHRLKDRIRVEKHYGNLPRVECHPNRLNQVFMNLLVNAAQAIPDQGAITITTGRKNNYATISIQDTGVGIPSQNIPKIFDPGFTTKGVGVGTGLGLSICYKIIQEHHGRIEVQSGSRGTTFTVELPLKRSQKGDS